jgi:small-conductance mechanosensitive channel
VFAAIHFYTQWFARLGAHPGAILAAGAITIAIGFALKSLLATMPPRTA